MSHFKLPISSIVNRVIPKNSFDEFTNTKQRKKLTEVVDKITWLNKLSKETINLTGKEINEIQIFELKLKEQVYPKDLLDIIDKAIPYQIIFILSYQDTVLYSTSKKHIHPLNQDNAVIDWCFASEWLTSTEDTFTLNLKISQDFIYTDFCSQLSNAKEQKNIAELIEYDKTAKSYKKQISELQKAIKVEKQFNKKVEMNIVLRELCINYMEFLVK